MSVFGALGFTGGKISKGSSMDPLSMLGSAFGGGFGGSSAGPSNASSGNNFLQMNSPFTVAGQGGNASTSTPTGDNSMMLMMAAMIVGAVLIVGMK